jgi:hypothetical protein
MLTELLADLRRVRVRVGGIELARDLERIFELVAGRAESLRLRDFLTFRAFRGWEPSGGQITRRHLPSSPTAPASDSAPSDREPID